MKKILIILLIFISTATFSQSGSEIDYLTMLDQKSQASYEDAVRMFIYQLDLRPASFQVNLSRLRERKITVKNYSSSAALTKGMIAGMTVRYLKLNDSLMYMITGAERYAFRNCLSYKIMEADSSENDPVSGTELIEIFSRITETEESRK